MTMKQVQAAKKAAAAARRAHTKAVELAKHQKDDAATVLVAGVAADAHEAAEAADEVEAGVQKRLEREAAMEKEDPSLWERVKKWFE